MDQPRKNPSAPGQTTRVSPSRLEDLLAEFLADHGRDQAAFDEFCVQHPADEIELRVLYEAVHATANCFDECVAQFEQNTWPGRRALASARGASDEHGALWGRLAEDGARRTRYEVRGPIAEGGMGHVLEVWDRDLRRTLAMKCVGQSDAEPPEPSGRLVSRFLEEAQITGQLQHPGIVPVHELGLDEDERAYFTMPHVGRREFREVIQLARAERDGWSLARALGVLVKICEAVGFAHSKNVLHRDLKPSNVMVGQFGETYVMDWGLARVLDRADTHDIRLRPKRRRRPVTTERTSSDTPGSPLVTVDGDVVGTPAYMSPEQARGRVEELDQRSDVYSIGAMLYHLLTGHAPYGGQAGHKTPHALLTAVLLGAPRPVLEIAPTVPVELAGICAKAMEREPGARYSSALELARDIEAYLGSRPVSVQEATPAYLLRLALRRNRALCVTVLTALLIAAAWATLDLRQVRAAWHREQGLAAEATEAREATQRLSDKSRSELLRTRADELHPGKPGALAAMTAWLAAADDVLGRLPDYRSESGLGAAGTDLAELIAELELLEPVRTAVATRKATAGELPERTLIDAADLWEAAIEGIRTSKRYGGLEIEPQIGLIPLRCDPWSGLWEFWLPLTGSRPFVGADDQWRIEPESAVVLVLVPGGTWLPLGRGRGRPEPLEVEPSFIAKYEVTHGQWEHVMGAGYRSYAELIVDLPLEEPLLHPVDCISFVEALEFANRVGCTLPSEYEWELACRGGSDDSYYWWGNSFDGVERLENLADQSAAGRIMIPVGDWNDGSPIHAPVGSFAANPYGLFDIAGNVSEWCLNHWPNDQGPRRAFRGGSWYHPAEIAASGWPQADHPGGRNQSRGFRIARVVR